MWSLVCELQEPRTPRALFVNIKKLFALRQLSTQSNASYIGNLRGAVAACKAGGQDFSGPLLTFVALNGLDMSRYQKVLDSFEVGALDWSSKSLAQIEEELTLIKHCTSLAPGNLAAAASATKHGPPCRPGPSADKVQPTPAPALPPPTTPAKLNHKQALECVGQFSEDGCPLCGHKGHPMEKCWALLKHGYVVKKDKAAADALLASLRPLAPSTRRCDKKQRPCAADASATEQSAPAPAPKGDSAPACSSISVGSRFAELASSNSSPSSREDTFAS